MFDQKGYTYYNVDITQKKELTNTIVKLKPDYIIHTAAMTNVDACELNQKECDSINVDAVKTIVDLCKVDAVISCVCKSIS